MHVVHAGGAGWTHADCVQMPAPAGTAVHPTPPACLTLVPLLSFTHPHPHPTPPPPPPPEPETRPLPTPPFPTSSPPPSLPRPAAHLLERQGRLHLRVLPQVSRAVLSWAAPCCACCAALHCAPPAMGRCAHAACQRTTPLGQASRCVVCLVQGAPLPRPRTSTWVCPHLSSPALVPPPCPPHRNPCNRNKISTGAVISDTQPACPNSRKTYPAEVTRVKG